MLVALKAIANLMLKNRDLERQLREVREDLLRLRRLDARENYDSRSVSVTLTVSRDILANLKAPELIMQSLHNRFMGILRREVRGEFEDEF